MNQAARSTSVQRLILALICSAAADLFAIGACIGSRTSVAMVRNGKLNATGLIIERSINAIASLALVVAIILFAKGKLASYGLIAVLILGVTLSSWPSALFGSDGVFGPLVLSLFATAAIWRAVALRNEP